MQLYFPQAFPSRAFVHNWRLNLLMSNALQSNLVHSTCPERRVSAAMLGYGQGHFHLLSVGVNGALDSHVGLPLYLHKRYCIHAEGRAIMSLPVNFRKYDIISYSSLAPCYRCANKLHSIGIRAHVYVLEYEDPTGVEYLLDKRIPVYKLKVGHLIPVDPSIQLSPKRLDTTANLRGYCA
jgi:deoxycytidylate deaminase